ncbi:MAG: hypothetical protein Q4G03_08410 [Planctomycetia bacterium]|nr:hypothetical protein [Planctomycetia bacterium]
MKKTAPPLVKTSQSLFDSLATQGDDLREGFAQSQEIESTVKRPSVWAILSAIIALPALLALLNYTFLFFAVLAIFAAILALATIKRSGGELVGAKFAYLGVVIACLAIVATPCNYFLYRYNFERQADQFFRVWFDAATQGDVTALRQLNNFHWQRATIVDHHDEIDFWARLKGDDEEPHYALHQFLSNPTMLTLRAFGDKAHASFYSNPTIYFDTKGDEISSVYAITCDPIEEGAQRQTFFLKVAMKRVVGKNEEGQKLIGWQMLTTDFTPMSLDAQGRPDKDNK